MFVQNEEQSASVSSNRYDPIEDTETQEDGNQCSRQMCSNRYDPIEDTETRCIA